VAAGAGIQVLPIIGTGAAENARGLVFGGAAAAGGGVFGQGDVTTWTVFLPAETDWTVEAEGNSSVAEVQE
jgi:hypothetical protein